MALYVPDMTDPTDQPDHLQRDARVVLSSWPRLLSVKLLAKYLSVGVQTVRNRKAEIPGLVQLGRSVRWDRQIVDDWVSRADPGADLFSP